MMDAEEICLRRRFLCILLALSLAVICCSCNMRGDTQVLNQYTAEALYKTYTAVQNKALKLQIPRTETVPELRTTMMQSPDYYERMASLYLYNESEYYITIHGYAWIAETTDIKNTHQAIYYYNEKKVANADYNIRLDPGNNTYLLYEVLYVSQHIPTADSIYFLFFRHEDTEYVGAATADDNFVFWPLTQTLK